MHHRLRVCVLMCISGYQLCVWLHVLVGLCVCACVVHALHADNYVCMCGWGNGYLPVNADNIHKVFMRVKPFLPQLVTALLGTR